VLTHALLEELDFARAGVPTSARAAALAAGLGLEAREADVEHARGLAEAFAASAVARRLAAATRLRREHEFSFTLDLDEGAVPLTGAVDLLAVEPGGGWLVVDAKTDAVAAGDDLEAVVESAYGAQRDLYALAALRAGAPSVDVVHAFLARPDEPVSASFTAADATALTERLAGPAGGIARGAFAPTDMPHAGLCGSCPARARLCPHPRELKLRPAPPRSASR
jgi:ATP-dependent exoDNAse (exonuclease V) beta subunit